MGVAAGESKSPRGGRQIRGLLGAEADTFDRSIVGASLIRRRRRRRLCRRRCCWPLDETAEKANS